MIFVFGSNLAGRHGKGAAKHASLRYGAINGIGEGRTGDSYAIPTKGKNLEIRSLDSIEQSIVKFLDYAIEHQHEVFIVTPIGTGLAGYRVVDIKRLFTKHFDNITQNVVFHKDWFK